jgi:monomeric isocitrate dehydrogenase
LGRTKENVNESGTAGAAVLNVTKETVSRWKRLPEFRAELNTLIEEIREAARNRLAGMLENALEVIKADLQTSDNPTRRIGTAFKILQIVGTGFVALPTEPLPIDAEIIR